MSIIIESIISSGQLTGSHDHNQTRFIADNQSSIITVETNVRFETYETPATDEEFGTGFMMLQVPGSFTGKIQDSRTVYSDKPGGFSEEQWTVGDSWKIRGMGIEGNNIDGIIEEISEDRKTLITNHNFSIEQFPLEAYIANTTTITAITFKHGLIENNESVNFRSKVDGSEQIAHLGGINFQNTNFQTMLLLGNKSWQSGSIQVKGNNIGIGDPGLTFGVVQAFTVKHELVINPLMLAEDWNDILNRLKPEWLKNSASLRYVTEVNLSAILKNPNETAKGVFGQSELGNVGWFNENFNGGPSDYSFSDVVYTNLAGDFRSGIELTENETIITFKIHSDTNSLSTSQTNLIFGFNAAPSDKSQYRDNIFAAANTMEENFSFDNVLSVSGNPSGVPRKFGTVDQVIKSMTATRVDASLMNVEVRIQMSSTVVGRIAAGTLRRVMIYLEVSDHLLTRANSDKVQLLLDANDMFVDFSDSGMITMVQQFLTHPFSDIETELVTEVNGFLEDDIVGVNDFFLDRNGREEDEIVFTSIRGQVIVLKDTGAAFVLDSTGGIALSALPNINEAPFGDIPNPNITIPRGFKTPADDNRLNIQFFRNYAADALGEFFFRFQFPFMVEWAPYLPLAGVNDDFFDPNEPNDGFNRDWNRYDLNPDWRIYFQTILNTTKNGEPLQDIALTRLHTHNYTDGPEWAPEVVRFFDENGDELINGGEKFIIKYADTEVRIDFTYIGPGSNPSLGDLVGVMKIHVFEEGTKDSTYWLSSRYDQHPNTWWKSIDGLNRVVITDEGGGVFRLTALLDKDQLPIDTPFFQVTGRIYDGRALVPLPAGKLLSTTGGFKKISDTTNTKVLSD